MAKKKVDDLILELQELFLEREIKYLNKALTVDNAYKTPEEIELQQEIDRDELKFLKNLKSRIKYIVDLNNQLTGKTGKDKSNSQEELWSKIKDLKSSVSAIVKSIPKHN